MLHEVAVLVFFASLAAVSQASTKRPVCPENSSCVYNNNSSLPDYNEFNYNISESACVYIKYLEREIYCLRCITECNIAVDNHNLPAMTNLVEVEIVEIHDCLIPLNTSFYDALKTWNIIVTKKLALILGAQSANPILQERHLRGLNINELKIRGDDIRDPPTPSQYYLRGVIGLQTLILHNVIPDAQALMQLPDTLETLNLMNAHIPTAISVVNKGSAWLERLRSLKSLILQEPTSRVYGYVPITLPKFNDSLLNLTDLSLTNIPLNSSSLAGTLNRSSIKTLVLCSTGLNILPDKIFEGANLTMLEMKYHDLSVPGDVFSPLQWLTTLALPRNNLDAATLMNVVSSLPRLQTLKAEGNPLGSLCSDADIISTESRWPKSLRSLELGKTNATRICPEWVENDELVYIDLKDNNIGDLTYNDLKMKRAVMKPVTLNLSNNSKLRIVNVSSADIVQCSSNLSALKDSNNRTQVKVIVNIKIDDVRCDYGAYWLTEALSRCPLWLKSGEGYSDPGELSCPYNGDCLPECSCKKRPRDNATVVNCTGPLPQAPPWPPSSKSYPLVLHVEAGILTAIPTNITTLVELHAPNNNISRLAAWEISDTLMILDVRNNSIHHISEEAARKLSSEGRNRSFLLKGNLLDCTCSDVPAYELIANSKVVLDWNDALCSDSIYVSDKMISGLCFPALHLGLSLSCLGLLFTLGLLLHHFKPQIRQALFTLNCCRRYVFRVKDNDTEKEKDVFMSYCQKDLAQMNKIKDALENKGYSTIEHNRDFEPGKPIFSQIEESVLKTRRTVVILSDNFINSQWMPHEFRLAHAHAMRHQTSKLVVIRYNLSEETINMLPSDLQTYIKNYTYLDWDNKQFWKTLYKDLGPPRFQIALRV